MREVGKGEGPNIGATTTPGRAPQPSSTITTADGHVDLPRTRLVPGYTLVLWVLFTRIYRNGDGGGGGREITGEDKKRDIEEEKRIGRERGVLMFSRTEQK